MISRDIIHIPTAGISILVALQGKKANVYFAFCNPKDTFNKKIANQILNGRMKQKSNRNMVELDYIGNTPRKDLLFPIADFVRDQLDFIYDDDENRYLHPDSFRDLMDNGVVEPIYRVPRSPSRLMEQVRNYTESFNNLGAPQVTKNLVSI